MVMMVIMIMVMMIMIVMMVMMMMMMMMVRMVMMMMRMADYDIDRAVTDSAGPRRGSRRPLRRPRRRRRSPTRRWSRCLGHAGPRMRAVYYACALRASTVFLTVIGALGPQ